MATYSIMIAIGVVVWVASELYDLPYALLRAMATMTSAVFVVWGVIGILLSFA